MLVTSDDMKDVERLSRECSSLASTEQASAMMWEFFHRRLHLLLACGYDELRYSPQPVLPRAAPDRRRRVSQKKPRKQESPVLLIHTSPDSPGKWGAVRDSTSGAWYYVAHAARPTQSRRTEPGIALIPIDIVEKPLPISFVPLEAIVHACHSAKHDRGAVTLPNIWQPPNREIQLVHSVRAIVHALREETISLDDLTWQQMEDVVAELLSSRGLEVYVTSRTADGGRDVIARGELIPGEPSILAVEVKHKEVVNLFDARNALWANRQFPLVMLATSGRFSGGVIRERNTPDNQFRLLLKDRVALTQWLNQYETAR